MNGHVRSLAGKWCAVAIVATGLLVGCERKEKVLDIEGPGVDIEVNKTTSPSGEKGVEIESGPRDKPTIEVDTK